MNLLKRCLGILYPQTCCFCGTVCRENICPECAKKVEYIKEPRCKKCGKPIYREEKELCYDCENNQLAYEQGRSVWLHKGPVKWSVYQFKYRNRRIYAEFYAEEMYRLYGTKLKEWEIETIIPIPLHKKRRRQRGYNQAEVLAKHLGRLSGLSVDTKCVMRVRNTKPQKMLNFKERRKNVKDVFRVVKQCEIAKNILLIDDIYTTGNTINAVTRVLKEKGVQKVWFLTISIGQGN